MEDITMRTPENVPAEPLVIKRYDLDSKTSIEVREDGVWFIESKVSKAGKAYDETVRVASSIIDIEGLIDPIDSEVDASLLVRIDDRRATVKREDLIQAQDIGKWLAARKAFFNPKHLSLLARMFMETRPPEVIGYTRNGWQRNGAFVVGDTVLLGVGHVLKTEAIHRDLHHVVLSVAEIDVDGFADTGDPQMHFPHVRGVSAGALPELRATGGLYPLAAPARTARDRVGRTLHHGKEHPPPRAEVSAEGVPLGR